MQLTMAIQPRTPLLVQMLASSPMLISVLDSILFGAIVALLTLQLGGAGMQSVAFGTIAFVAAMTAFLAFAGRQVQRARTEFTPMAPARGGRDGSAVSGGGADGPPA